MEKLKLFFLIVMTLPVFLHYCCSAQEKINRDRGSRPNIILIMSDDMGFSDIGCYGGEINTPNLDRLAEHGIQFTQFYNAARCCPTRASLLTGLYPHQAGIGWMTGVDIETSIQAYQGDLNFNCVTLAEVAKSAGYSTFAAGKWHVSKNVRDEGPKHNWPLQRGFDRYYGTIQGAGSYYDPATLCRDNKLINPLTDMEYNPKNYYYTDAISDEAARFINERDRNRPFFLYIAYTAAHWPMQAKPEDIRKYKGKYDSGWEEIRKQRYQRMKEIGVIKSGTALSTFDSNHWEDTKNKEVEAGRMEIYAAMIDAMDQGIGRVIGMLKKENIFENTVIIYLQDNGGCAEEIGSKGKTRPVSTIENELIPLQPGDIEYRIIPGITRNGKQVMQGEDISGGPDTTYVAYGKAWAKVSNTPFREYKHWVHEGGISTPLIVHYPDGINQPGQLCSFPCHIIDIMPTIVELTDAEYPCNFNDNIITPMEGISLLLLLNGNKQNRTNPIFWEHEMNRAVRLDNWKLVSKGSLHNGTYGNWENYSTGKWELYNINNDRSEMNDLSSQYPEKKSELETLWKSIAERVGVFPAPWKEN
jgi:arylsulfatase